MYKIKLTQDWQLISELDNTIQLLSGSNLDTILLSCGDAPNENAYFIFENNKMMTLPPNERVWGKAFSNFAYLIALADTIKESCFLPDGDFDCSAYVVRESLVYC